MAWIPAALRPIAALVAVSLVSLPAYAAPRVAALIPQVRPNSTPELQNRFHEAITRGLQGPDVDVTTASEVRMRFGVSDELLNCSAPGICAARAATALKADRTVAGEISNFGKDYTIRLVMIDAAGREVARTEEPCDICTVKEADDAAARAAGKLMLATRSNMPQQTTATTPPPPPKEQPKEAEPAPPPAPKEAEPLPPGAQPEPIPPGGTRPLEKKHFPWLGVGIGSLVLGVVGIAVGAPLIAIDGQPTCDPGAGKDPKTSCPDVWDTGAGGAAMVTIGVLGVAAGVSLIVVDVVVKKKRAAHVSVAPTARGAMLTGQLEF
jgi:hypothetical protein